MEIRGVGGGRCAVHRANAAAGPHPVGPKPHVTAMHKMHALEEMSAQLKTGAFCNTRAIDAARGEQRLTLTSLRSAAISGASGRWRAIAAAAANACRRRAAQKGKRLAAAAAERRR